MDIRPGSMRVKAVSLYFLYGPIQRANRYNSHFNVVMASGKRRTRREPSRATRFDAVVVPLVNVSFPDVHPILFAESDALERFS